MSDTGRPGGLTTLAVINFILALPQFFGLAFQTTLYFAGDWLSEALPTPDGAEAPGFAEVLDTIGALPVATKVLSVTISALVIVLLVLSGIGYLKQKQFLGRTLGNSYAALSLLSVVVGLTLLNVGQTGGFGIGTMISMIYPLLTLYLLNVVFKEDLVR